MASWIEAFEEIVDEDTEHQKLYEEVRDKLKGAILTLDDEGEDGEDQTRGRDQVGSRLKAFRDEIESLCKPIVDREYLGS